jgi:hypothetical protein
MQLSTAETEQQSAIRARLCLPDPKARVLPLSLEVRPSGPHGLIPWKRRALSAAYRGAGASRAPADQIGSKILFSLKFDED